MWAADCLPSLTSSQPVNAFDSLAEILFPAEPSLLWDPDPGRRTYVSAGPSNVGDNLSVVERDAQAAILRHYRECLSTLVSCSDGQHSSNAFDAFISIASANISTPAGQGLHLSLLAWAGRHMVNRGQMRYEAISEKLGTQAAQILDDRMEKMADCTTADLNELLTLFAAVLMMVQYKVSLSSQSPDVGHLGKICRGDVWGFGVYLEWLQTVSTTLYPSDQRGDASDSIKFQL